MKKYTRPKKSCVFIEKFYEEHIFFQFEEKKACSPAESFIIKNVNFS